MSRLAIRVKGEIESSNFEEWKGAFISRIQSIDTELKTDDDFALAVDTVKQLKAGEKMLREAKQAALDQSSDIQRLFTAIDDVTEQARRTRLELERQIRTRKQEIKETYVRAGIEKARELVASRNEDFRSIDHASFLAPERFYSAIKGKAGTKGIAKAIDGLLERIEAEISKRAAEVDRNATVLATLHTEHQLLFQDRGALLALTEPELLSVVDQRVAAFNEEHTRSKTSLSVETETNLIGIPSPPANSPVEEAPENFQITIDMRCSQQVAVDLARSIRQQLDAEGAVTDIRLTRAR